MPNPLFSSAQEFAPDGRPIMKPWQPALHTFRVKPWTSALAEIKVGDATLVREYVTIDCATYEPTMTLIAGEADRLANLSLRADEVAALGDVLQQALVRKAARERQSLLDAEDSRLKMLEIEAWKIKQARAARKLDPPFVRHGQ